MEQLPNNKPINRTKYLGRLCKANICLFVERFYRFMKEKFCYTKEQIEEINETVKKVEKQSENFEVVKEKLPPFFEEYMALQKKNDELFNDNIELLGKIGELFEAEQNDNPMRRYQIFKELGFESKKIVK